MNESLLGVARALVHKFGVPMGRVSELCPSRLLHGYRYREAFCRVEMDAEVNAWHDAVQAEAQEVARRKEAMNLDAKRLRYFRRRYGPHITVDHLPRGRK